MTFFKSAGIAIALSVATLVPSIVPSEAAGRGGRHFGAQPFRPHPGSLRDVFKPAPQSNPGTPRHPDNPYGNCDHILLKYHETDDPYFYEQYLLCIDGLL